MTKYFLLLAFLLCYDSLMAQETVYSDSILARVNGKIITRFELNEMTQRHQSKIMSEYSKEIAQQRILELKKSALKQYIDNVIILDEFKTKNFNVPKSLVDKELENEINSRAKGDRQKFAQILDHAGISIEEFREQISESLSVELMVNENVKRKVNVTPIDISRYYSENGVKFQTNAEVRIAIIGILMKPDRVATEMGITVNMLSKKLTPDNFAMMADEFSELPGKPKGGDEGFKKFNEFNLSFKNALKDLSINQITPPVKLGDNTFFLKLVNKRGGTAIPLLDVRSKIKNFLEDQQERKYYAQFISNLRNKASIEDFSTK